MTLVDEVKPHVDTRDLVVMTLVEALNDGGQTFPTPVAIASQISGAPVNAVATTMERLSNLKVLDERLLPNLERMYHVNDLGAELLISEVPGWEPHPAEVRRRDRERARHNGLWTPGRD